jgi:hypothetical protein
MPFFSPFGGDVNPKGGGLSSAISFSKIRMHDVVGFDLRRPVLSDPLDDFPAAR